MESYSQVVLFFVPFFRVAPGGWKGGFDDATCWKRNVDGVEGGSLAGVCDTSISTGSTKDISIVIRTCGKSVFGICKGSSAKLERMGALYEEEICISDNGCDGSRNWLFRMWFIRRW